jgi:SAM-dependent methyltransferase
MGDAGRDQHIDLVRFGYDAVSERYRGDDDRPPEHAAWLRSLSPRLPPRTDVLDLGCGCGVPVSRELTALGHEVVGVDLSDRQVERARRLVPQARFIRADATEISFDEGTFDAIVCLYMLIHVPLDRQERLLRRMRNWQRPGGVLLATVGARAWSGHDDWLGSGAPMWWSHADAGSYRRWLTAAGFATELQPPPVRVRFWVSGCARDRSARSNRRRTPRSARRATGCRRADGGSRPARAGRRRTSSRAGAVLCARPVPGGCRISWSGASPVRWPGTMLVGPGRGRGIGTRHQRLGMNRHRAQPPDASSVAADSAGPAHSQPSSRDRSG